MTRNNESKVEDYLDQEVQKLGGITRKWVSPGRLGVPDRIVIIKGQVIFVELKTVCGVMSPWQKREIERLREQLCRVEVLYGRKDVDQFIARL